MATQPLHRFTIDQYLELEETLDYRSELHDGVIYPVELASVTHARLEERIGAILSQLSLPSCSIYGPSLNLYIESANKILHPDKTMICGKVDTPKPNCVVNPTLIAEVTSQKTIDYDYGQKRAYYFSLISLQHYLLVSQTECMLGAYSRREDGWLYVERRNDEDLKLSISGALVTISVADLYQGLLHLPLVPEE